MPRTKLTQHAIAKLQAPTATGKQIPYWDTDLTGFGVLCSGKTSAKSFIVQRDLPGGKSRRVTIANVNELKFADAKDRARKLLLDMRGGKDPKAKPRTGTLQETLDLYLASERLSPRSKRHYSSLVRIQLAPLKDRLLGSITPNEVDQLHRSIVGRSAANDAMKCLRMLFRWAAARDDDLGRNPVRLRKNEWHSITPKRNPIPFDRLPDFYNAVMELPPMGRDYILLLLFTGLRRREAAGLCWSEVDFERRIICLPGARIKTRSALNLPMTDFVADLLIARRQLGDADYVFPSRDESHIDGNAWTKTLRKRTGLQFSIHDLRRTFATVAESTDISWLSLKRLLNHTAGSSVTATYIALTPERLRAPAQKVCDRIKQLCNVQPASGDNVAVLRA
jgi:site-specific recombinase XerD